MQFLPKAKGSVQMAVQHRSYTGVPRHSEHHPCDTSAFASAAVVAGDLKDHHDAAAAVVAAACFRSS